MASAASSSAVEASKKRPAEEELVGPKPDKAYKSSEFLNSKSARMIRMMCELQQPGAQLEEEGVDNVVMIFGSARAKPKAEYENAVKDAEAKVSANPNDDKAQGALVRLKKQAFLMPYFDAVQDCAKLITEWSLKRVAEGKAAYHVGTGGGPGMMEAANKGAVMGGGRSVGFGISLPFEDRLNPYVSPDLAFEFHYFFTRKFWMSYKCMGLIVAPGGLGTCDELFEIITLMQTGKIRRSLPVILIGKDFWKSAINWDFFVQTGMISDQDANQLVFTDSAEEAFQCLVSGIERMEAAPNSPKKKKA
jgi:uncharacterized protein (TIGR00730 family)